ncbi:MAG: Sec-independent protein translocase TatA [Flexistipes sinusarabici]|uniref:Sec-independent protein translocase protein TatA n=1 Tax=Flexistipes sinusarabici TaxID=2352 RepID=A0A5D0MP86_FLESI|nr:twin-arginine translocase TatA/TatE family subunit [Flexistipes sinusarabici]TYB33108.1 MAG: Sec-independent protein translocase TatA [Flexistipes sinusarabici]
MFGLGMTEIILILVLALIVVGPKKLPEVAKGLGKGFAEFKKVMNDFKDAVNIDDIDESSSSSSRSKNKEISEVYKNKWQQDILQAEEENNDQENRNEEDKENEGTDKTEESDENVKRESRET